MKSFKNNLLKINFCHLQNHLSYLNIVHSFAIYEFLAVLITSAVISFFLHYLPCENLTFISILLLYFIFNLKSFLLEQIKPIELTFVQPFNYLFITMDY